MRKPNPTAKDPRPHVALLIETSLASGRDILRGVTRYMRENTPWSLYHEPHGLEDSIPHWLHNWHGDGIIARIQTPAMAKVLATLEVPTVDVLGLLPRASWPLVHVDDAAIGRMAAEHLLERNLRHFAFFGIKGENWSERRFTSFRDTLRQQRAGSEEKHIPRLDLPRDSSGKRPWERTQNEVARWLNALPKPTGVFVCSDQRGPGLLEACRRAGVNVPDDIAVVSVDNDETLCEVCDPPLSSIDAGHRHVGYEAARRLQSLLRGERGRNDTLRIPPRHVVTRQSSDMLAIADPALAAALRLIRDTAHRGIPVATVAKHVGLSRSVLQRRFRTDLKRSIHQEILAAKIKRARELLTMTELPLAVIAQRTGFKHQEYMGAVFKARLGETPGTIRRRLG